MLAEDATWSMLAARGDRAHGPASRYRGRAAIAAFLSVGPLSGAWRWRHRPTRANGQPAVDGYWDAEAGTYRLRALDVLTLRDGRIAAVTAFLDPTVLTDFGLPDQLHQQSRAGGGL
jgi:RNA polymerase sigma-70 factor (ECF subfamily)